LLFPVVDYVLAEFTRLLAAFHCKPHDMVLQTEVKVSRNGPERRSGKRIIAGTAFRLEFLVGWYDDADATMAVPGLY